MNFGWDLTTPYGRVTALHEIGHPLGFPMNIKAQSQVLNGTPVLFMKNSLDLLIIGRNGYRS